MDFKPTLPIYLQIADYICDRIISVQWVEGERIPSVRELGVLLEVNPNTVMRAFDKLQNDYVITNRRGVGYFVEENARGRVLAIRREEFLNETLPDVFATMRMLEIDINQVVNKWDLEK